MGEGGNKRVRARKTNKAKKVDKISRRYPYKIM